VKLVERDSRLSAQSLCCWVEKNLERFEPVRRARLPLFEEVKYIGDLSLILLALASQKKRLLDSSFQDWSTHIARRLWPSVEAYFEPTPWVEVLEEAKCRPVSVLPLMIVPALEIVSGERSARHEKVLESIGAARENSNGLTIEIAFVCDLAGMLNCSEQAAGEMSSRLTPQDGAEAYASNLYNLAHAIFFGTSMGDRDLPWPVDRREWLSHRLAELAATRVEKGDFDLGAELILCSSWIQPEIFAELGAELALLSELAESRGSIPPFSPGRDRQVNDFARCYHPTIFGLAVLAEYSAWNASLTARTF